MIRRQKEHWFEEGERTFRLSVWIRRSWKPTGLAKVNPFLSALIHHRAALQPSITTEASAAAANKTSRKRRGQRTRKMCLDVTRSDGSRDSAAIFRAKILAIKSSFTAWKESKRPVPWMDATVCRFWPPGLRFLTAPAEVSLGSCDSH